MGGYLFLYFVRFFCFGLSYFVYHVSLVGLLVISVAYVNVDINAFVFVCLRFLQHLQQQQ